MSAQRSGILRSQKTPRKHKDQGKFLANGQMRPHQEFLGVSAVLVFATFLKKAALAEAIATRREHKA